MKRKNTQKKKKVGSYPFYTVVFSIALSLSVIGILGGVVIHANKLSNVIQENIQLHVYLNTFITKAELIKVKKVLSSKPFVARDENQAPKIAYISKEDALKQYIKDTGDDFKDLIESNPLKSSFTVSINPKFLSETQLKEIKKEVEGINGIFEVDLNTNKENEIKSIHDNIESVKLFLIGFTVISVLAIMLLISNTIKLALFSQRFLIRSMQLVGATSSFIQGPFLKRAFLHGLTGGAIASLCTYALLQYSHSKVAGLHELYDPQNIFFLLLFLPVLGGLIGWISSYRAVNKYLKLSLDDLY